MRQADGCTQPGQIGSLLRREGLYSSQHWRAQYREGACRALRDDHRGRKRKRSLLEEENERLRTQVARLERRLNQAETIIEFQKKFGDAGNPPHQAGERRESLMESVQELATVTGVSCACRALGVARSTLYRSIRPASEPEPPRPRPKPDRALSEPERQEVLAQSHSERFVDRGCAIVLS